MSRFFCILIDTRSCPVIPIPVPSTNQPSTTTSPSSFPTNRPPTITPFNHFSSATNQPPTTTLSSLVTNRPPATNQPTKSPSDGNSPDVSRGYVSVAAGVTGTLLWLLIMSVPLALLFKACYSRRKRTTTATRQPPPPIRMPHVSYNQQNASFYPPAQLNEYSTPRGVLTDAPPPSYLDALNLPPPAKGSVKEANLENPPPYPGLYTS